MKAIRRFTVRAVLPDNLSALEELAGNLRWSWHEPTKELFARISPELWHQVEHDPVALLGAVDPGRLAELAADQGYVDWANHTRDELRAYQNDPRWYQTLGETAPRTIAYFSPEFGIAAALPQYSGGLGILAGDHLKAASDLGVPLVGVGLFYRSGYFSQAITPDGWQQESYPSLDPDGLPLSVLRTPDGTPVEISLALPDGVLHARVWQAAVGRVRLLLLDTDIPENEERLRSVTDRLYGGGGEHRLLQELLLGIGGVRALEAWSELTGAPAAEVFHTNEGHAGYLGLERIANLIGDGLSFDEALQVVRAGTVFTTHTPVPAGIDRFDRPLVERYFSTSLLPRVEAQQVLALGAEDYPGGSPDVFNMAVMGMRLGQHANGVSKLHGEVSRQMFSGLYPGFDPQEVPIDSVTNGVHAPTWTDPMLRALALDRLGTDDTTHADWANSGAVSDGDLWSVRNRMREQLVQDARQRLQAAWEEQNPGGIAPVWMSDLLDPNVLTIGFARRVPTYKRLTLMLHDPQRLRNILLHAERPVQFVIAGKSHPADDEGKRLIQKLVQFASEPEIRGRMVFLPDYDIGMAQLLYPGTDIWLNNPLRPLEACGTSGMKAALNGALNLSILDGWWNEFYDGENGWAIPSADAAGEGGGAGRARGRGHVRPHRAHHRAALLRPRRGRRAVRLGRPDPPHPLDPVPGAERGAHGEGVRGAALHPGVAERGTAQCGRLRRRAGTRRVEGPRPRGLAGRERRARRRGRRGRGAPGRRPAARARPRAPQRAEARGRPGAGRLRPQPGGRRPRRRAAPAPRPRRRRARHGRPVRRP